MKHKKFRVTGEGIKCPRCNESTEAREHVGITDKQLRQPFYYSKWFNCKNQNCKTTLIMLDEFKVENKNAASREMRRKEQERNEYQQQMNFIRNI